MAESDFRLEDHFDSMTLSYMRRAHGHDIEYKYSAVWQRYLGRMFQDPWQLICEQAPHDDSRKRMDYKVEYYNEYEGTISPVVFVEVKRPGGSVREVEEQGLAVAKSAIDGYGMTGIYVLTLWGLKFRAWYVTKQGQVLEPLFGPPVPGQKEMYLEITTPDGISELQKTIELIKADPPQLQAPVVPSQQAEMEQLLRSGTYYLDESSLAGGHDGGQIQPTMQSWGQFTTDFQATPASQNTPFSAHASNMQPWVPGQEAYDPNAMHNDDNPEEQDEDSEAEGGGKGKSKRKTKERKEVKVRLVTHMTRKDEYVFKGLDGSEKSTLLSEWKQKDRDGRMVYEYRGKRAIYWCKRLPER